MIDSFYVIKAPLIPCRGCSKMLKSGIEGMDLVVLEYVPSATLLFLCVDCASNRIILDHIAERMAEDVD